MVGVLKKTLVAVVALWLLAVLAAGFQSASQAQRQRLSFDVTLAPSGRKGNHPAGLAAESRPFGVLGKADCDACRRPAA